MQLPFEADTLHVISDLHLGGRDGFQIFRCGPEFEAFSLALCAEAETSKVCLIINGDFVDFLAEDPAEFFSAYRAEAKMRRILSDPSFLPVTQGLRQILARSNTSVAFNLGNHDLELALPWIGRALGTLLTDGDPARLSRLHFAFDGVGLRCRVGNAEILCLHGNEVDGWNVTDHEAIRKIARDMTRGLPVAEWVPNAGTQLVVTVMNDIKRRYPFVDILKPENDAVLPILAFLDPVMARKVLSLGTTLPRRAVDGLRLRAGWLGPTPYGGQRAGSHATTLAFDQKALARLLMEQAEERHGAGVRASHLIGEDDRKQLGAGAAFVASLLGKGRSEVLRAALDGLDADRSFDPHFEDDTFHQVDKFVGTGIDFVVTGHTHLRRALRRRHGGGWYYNSGTWAALMQIPPDLRRDADAFGLFIEGLANDDMSKLEKKGLLRREPTVASFWKEGNGVNGELRRVSIAGHTLVPVAGTRFKQG